MKKIVINITLLSTLLLIAVGCTLSMDEWVQTEEQKGYDEVEKVENDYYTLSYEYKKDTRSLTDDIQQYLVQVEADTILYFMDNMPEAWWPQQGGQVVANCCENFPMGLMGKVLSVEKQNGLVKVVTTEATLEECYEEFDMDFDSELFFNNQEEDEVDIQDDTTSVQGVKQRFVRTSPNGKKAEVVVRDWTMFNAIKKDQDLKEVVEKRARKAKRAELEDIYDQDIKDKETEDTKDLLLFEVTPTDDVGKKIMAAIEKAKTKKGKLWDKFGEPYVNVKVYSTTKTKIRKTVELKKKREYTQTTTYSGYKVNAQVGFDFMKTGKSKTEEWSNNINSFVQDSKLFDKLNEKLKPNTKGVGGFTAEDMEFTIEIPIGTLPFGLIVRIKPVLDSTLGIYGEYDVLHWTSGSETITEVVNGKKIKETNKDVVADLKKSLPSDTWNVSGFGKFSLTGGIEAFLGVGKKTGKKAMGIGGFVSLSLTAAINITPLSFGDYTISSSDDAFTRSLDLEFGGKILTAGLFGDIKFASKKIQLKEYTKHYHPRLDMNTLHPVVPDYDDDMKAFNRYLLSYRFTDLGMHISGNWILYNTPIVAVYEKDPKLDDSYDKPVKIVKASNFKSSDDIKTNTWYQFEYRSYNDKKLYFIPGVQAYGGSVTLYHPYKTTMQNNKPMIEYQLETTSDKDGEINEYFFQTYGNYTNATMSSIIGGQESHIWQYSVALPFIIHNASMIPSYWDDWGVYITTTIPGISDKYKSLKNQITKSGEYVVRFNNIYYNTNYLDERDYTATAYIYYVRKGEKKKNLINQSKTSDGYEFSFHQYKTKRSDPGDILLLSPITLLKSQNEEMKEHDKEFKNMNGINVNM